MEKLNDYILINIFEYLDFNSLIQATTVCKKWNSIIGQSSKVLKDLQLVVTDNSYNEQIQKNSVKRNYQKLLITFDKTDPYSWPNKRPRYSYGPNYFKQDISKIYYNQNSFRELTLNGVKLRASEFVRIISGLNFLENLEITSSCLIYRLKKFTPVNMMSLKKFKFHRSEFEYLEYIGETSIKECDFSRNQSKSESPCLLEFLQRQKFIEVLTIIGYSELHVIANYNENWKFKLQKLYSPEHTYDSELLLERIISFHAETLRYLDSYYDFSPSLLDIIFRKMKLESLKLFHYSLSYGNQSSEILNCIPENVYLKKLIFEHFPFDTSFEIILSVLRIYTNVQTLHIKNFFGTNAQLQQILSCLTNLKCLVLEIAWTDELSINSESLNELKIGLAVKWRKPSKHTYLNIPNLQKLIISEFSLRTKKHKIKCNLHQLKSFEISTPNLKFTDKFIKDLKNNCPILQELKISRSPSSEAIFDKLKDEKFRVYQYDNHHFTRTSDNTEIYFS